MTILLGSLCSPSIPKSNANYDLIVSWGNKSIPWPRVCLAIYGSTTLLENEKGESVWMLVFYDASPIFFLCLLVSCLYPCSYFSTPREWIMVNCIFISPLHFLIDIVCLLHVMKQVHFRGNACGQNMEYIHYAPKYFSAIW